MNNQLARVNMTGHTTSECAGNFRKNGAENRLKSPRVEHCADCTRSQAKNRFMNAFDDFFCQTTLETFHLSKIDAFIPSFDSKESYIQPNMYDSSGMDIASKLTCIMLLDYLKEKHQVLYSYFAGPALAVLAPSLQAKYQSLISRPRDLEMIRLKVNQGMYQDIQDFADDVQLCFENAKLFCSGYKEFKGVYDAAITIAKIFSKRLESEFKGKPGKAKQRPSAVFAVVNSIREATPSVRKPISEMCASIAERVVNPLKAEQGIGILLHPVPPAADFYKIYSARIKQPMDISTILSKLLPAPRVSNSAKDKSTKSSGSPGPASQHPAPYVYVDEFCHDMRCMFANAIRYNCHADKGSIAVRRSVTAIAVKFEQRWLDWNKKHHPEFALCPPLPEMRVCLAALEAAFKVVSAIPGAPAGTPAIVSFIDPVEIQLTGELLQGYRREIEYPMDFGTIVSKVLGAESGERYKSSQDFFTDVKRVTANCEKYWSKRTSEGGADYIADAHALQDAVEARLASVAIEGPPLLQTLEQLLSPPPFIPAKANPAPKGRLSASGSNMNLGASSGSGLSFSLKRSSTSSTALAPPTTVPASVMSADTSAVTAMGAAFEPEQVFRYVSTLEQVHFYLPAVDGDRHESANQLERRASKYAQSMLLGILEDEVQRHYLKTPTGTRIPTCNPFVNKVDQRIFPEYGEFLRSENREEVCLQYMARKVRSGQYGMSFVAAVQDMQRLRENAHAFNVGDENIETRIMADCVANYFSYLLKTCLTGLLNSSDQRLKQFVLTAETIPLLDVPTAPDVLTFLQLLEEDHIAEQRKQAQELARRRASSAALVLPSDQTLPSEFDMSMENDAMLFENDINLFDFDMDLSNSVPIAPHYDVLSMGMGKGKGKSSSSAFALPQHVKTEWEIAATAVLNKICKHPFVDMSRRSSAVGKSLLIADFFRPVVDREYQQVVQQPIDLTILGAELDQGLLLDPEDFYDKLTRVFFNLVKFNEREGIAEHQKKAAQEMVIKGNHLARYCKWLCLENLPCKSADVEARHDKPELLGELRESVQLVERKTREELLIPAPITNNAIDAKKLLGNLKKTRNKTEAILMGWFCEPPVQPSDYAVYVRRPMDLGTVGARLDQGSYRTYGEVISDIRLVFQNSIKYNSVHMALDKGSKEVHDAAREFLNKFEALMPTFTLETTERVERDRIVNLNFQRLEMENYQRRLQEQQQLALFQEQEKRRRLDQDAAFRADQDVEQKKAQTALEQKEYEAQQKRLWGEMQERAEEAAYDDGAAMMLAGLTEEAKAEQLLLLERRTSVRLQGLGPAAVVPAHLLPHVDSITAMRAAAWEEWAPVAIRGNQSDAAGGNTPSAAVTAHSPQPAANMSLDVTRTADLINPNAPSTQSSYPRKRGWIQHDVSSAGTEPVRNVDAGTSAHLLNFENELSNTQSTPVHFALSSLQPQATRPKLQALTVFGF